MAMTMPDEVYCTMVLTPSYLWGAEVVVHELRRLDAQHKIVCLATPETLDIATLERLSELFDVVELVEPIVAGLSPQLASLDRPDLHSATTKFHLWNLPYSKVVYIDADTSPVQTSSPLFDTDSDSDPRTVAAAPDAGWPDTFNSGLLVLKPDHGIYNELLSHSNDKGSFDGADQGILNEVMAWKRSPFLYNVTVNTAYEYAPAYERFKTDVRSSHFIGPVKPWDSRSLSKIDEQWWTVYKQATLSDPILDALTAAERAHKLEFDLAKTIAPSPDYWDARTHEPFKSTRPEFAVEPELAAPTGVNPAASSKPSHHRAKHLSVKLTKKRHVPSVPETASKQLNIDPVHVFPASGPSLVKLPFERDQIPAEREF